MLSVVHGGITSDVYVTSRVTSSCREKVQTLVPIWHCARAVGAVGRHIGIRVRLVCVFLLAIYFLMLFCYLVTLCFALFCFVVLPCVLHLHRCGIIMRHNKPPYIKPGLQCCCNLQPHWIQLSRFSMTRLLAIYGVAFWTPYHGMNTYMLKPVTYNTIYDPKRMPGLC